jgi:uncharacterized membrane protein YqaE (UPF0057 family)
MISQIKKHMKKASLILIILTIFLSVNVSSLEAGRCEKALLNCLLDSLWSIPHFTRVYRNIAYCLNGWVFCGKYLEK